MVSVIWSAASQLERGPDIDLLVLADRELLGAVDIRRAVLGYLARLLTLDRRRLIVFDRQGLVVADLFGAVVIDFGGLVVLDHGVEILFGM